MARNIRSTNNLPASTNSSANCRNRKRPLLTRRHPPIRAPAPAHPPFQIRLRRGILVISLRSRRVEGRYERDMSGPTPLYFLTAVYCNEGLAALGVAVASFPGRCCGGEHPSGCNILRPRRGMLARVCELTEVLPGCQRPCHRICLSGSRAVTGVLRRTNFGAASPVGCPATAYGYRARRRYA